MRWREPVIGVRKPLNPQRVSERETLREVASFGGVRPRSHTQVEG